MKRKSNKDYKFSDDGFMYKIENNEVTIYKYTGEDCEELTVPAVIEGLPVTDINGSLVGNTGLCNSDTLKRVIVPEGVKKIAMFTFGRSKSLESVIIPASVTEMGASTFSGSKSLLNITVDENNPQYADIDGVLFNKDKTELIFFPNGRAEEHYTIPEYVTKIGFNSFAECPIKSVTIPGSIADVKFVAFKDCRNLANVILMEGIKTISCEAFENCGSLTNITIPASVTKIELRAFNGCTSLVNITVDKNNTEYSDFDGILYNKEQTKMIYVPLNNPFTDDADSVTEYGKLSLGENERHKVLDIPASVIKIHPEAFDGCESLRRINVHEDNPVYCDIDGVLFNKDKTKLLYFPMGKTGDYYIPDGVTEIGEYAFFRSRLINITTADRFHKCIYCGDRSLNVIMPNSVKIIGYRAFGFCGWLKNVFLPDGVEIIEAESFWEAPIQDIYLPDSITKLDDNAFAFCDYISDEAWEKILKVNPNSYMYGKNTINIQIVGEK